MSHTKFGKWSEPGVPHKGWQCVDVTDLGRDERQLCEMCEAMLIRFVHSMRHDNYSDVLECGCICAGNMEEDIDGAKQRENQLKRQARRARYSPLIPPQHITNPVAVPRWASNQLPSQRAATPEPDPSSIVLKPGWYMTPERWARTVIGDYEITVCRGHQNWRADVKKVGSFLRVTSYCVDDTSEKVIQWALNEVSRNASIAQRALANFG